MAQQQIDIEILNVGSPAFTKTARGGYNKMEVAFKNLTFDSKVEGKNLVDFNDKALFEFFKGLKNGDKITVTKEKGDNDQYWNWVAADYSGAQGTGSGANVPSQQNNGATGGSTGGGAGSQEAPQSRGRVTGSNYETSEERAKRQVYIVRQSSIGAAIELLKANTTSCSTPSGEKYIPITKEQVLETAKAFEKYVFGE
jgi:hypothetical protein